MIAGAQPGWQFRWWIAAPLAAARGRLFPFVPVLIGCGVGLWFMLPADPSPRALALAGAIMLAGGVIGWRGGDTAAPLAIAAFCIAAGFLAADLRARMVDAPRLSFRYYGPVEGRIVTIDRSQADRTRLTLDRVRLADVPPRRTPARVRVSLHGAAEGHGDLWPGQVVILTAHLSPPDGPVEPGGFDFRRMAYFDGLGAVGYARTPVLVWADPEPGEARVNRLRSTIRAGVEARLPGDSGAFAAALVTGDRAGLSPAALQALRDSNLAHLLAISGLHMGLLAAFVFAAFRWGFALIPPLALRINAKKVAAVIALLAGAFYLLLSGGNVATERAYVMVAVMLVAVLFDRRALSLRSVAIAGTILLLLQPETLTEPGFQMSFAATVALIAGFGALRGRFSQRSLPWWLAPLAMTLFSSMLAGLATAPVAAAHFNRMADYGLLANLLAVPVMGMLVMPAAVVAGVLAPLGLEGLPLAAMDLGTRWILAVAHGVAALDGAVTTVPVPPGWVLPAMALGALWLIVWPGWARIVGLVPVAVAVAGWALAERPALLISADGALLGLTGAEGRALSAAKGAGFAARQWLENDGDRATQAAAAARPGFDGPGNERSFLLGTLRGLHLTGKDATARLASACARADLVILRGAATGTPPGCLVIDDRMRAETGAIAAWVDGGGLHLRPTEGARRRWSPAPRRDQ
ncbi:MAG: ComEC family competence protein [Paracoccaceae bacterium]|nr:MAG: ComEC family competence protein [Paracoccaceae bacterium]